MPVLSIAIPTYNRAGKLARVLASICGQVSQSNRLSEKVEVIVSDNASSDETQQILANCDCKGVRFQHYRQGTNLGLDGNMSFLYRKCRGNYVWFFSDDDILFPGAVERVLEQLEKNAPDALLFSFVQPPGSVARTFDFDQPELIVSNPETLIRLLARAPKLSIYTLKRIEIAEKDDAILREFLGTDYYFIALAYTILQRSQSPKLCVLSEPLAGCDSDFNVIRFSPETWGRAWVVFRHPYARAYAPHLEKQAKQAAYYDQIQALFGVKTGTLVPTDPIVYDRFISQLEYRFGWLLVRPRSFVQVLFLKLKMAEFWPSFRRCLSFFRQ